MAEKTGLIAAIARWLVRSPNGREPRVECDGGCEEAITRKSLIRESRKLRLDIRDLKEGFSSSSPDDAG